jgi:biotin carboxyl carrier protein
LNFQGFEISVPASAEVVRISGDSLAAKFVDLGERETELLRSFTSSIISGETTSVENILTWIDSPAPLVPVTSKPESPRTERKQRVRRTIRAGLYLIAGVIVGGFIVLTLALFFRLRIDTAVISAALDQMVSQDVGKLAEVFVEPGNRVRAGQPLFHVEAK